jgi:kumamolisin
MPVAEARVALPGTERQAPPDARALGQVEPAEPVEVSVLLQPRAALGDLDARLARGDPPLSREAFAATYGADPAAVAAVEHFAAEHGLQVVQSDAARRTVVLGGTAEQIGAAFGVDLQRFQSADGATFRSHSGPIYVPPALDGIVQAVLGLDTRPAAQHH